MRKLADKNSTDQNITSVDSNNSEHNNLNRDLEEKDSENYDFEDDSPANATNSDLAEHHTKALEVNKLKRKTPTNTIDDESETSEISENEIAEMSSKNGEKFAHAKNNADSIKQNKKVKTGSNDSANKPLSVK